MTSIDVNQILTRLDQEQKDLYAKWKDITSDTIKAIVKAIQREHPLARAPSAESSRRGVRLLVEAGSKKISLLTDREIKEIVRKTSTTNSIPGAPGMSDPKEEWKDHFQKQGHTPEDAEKMADIALKGRHGSSVI